MSENKSVKSLAKSLRSSLPRLTLDAFLKAGLPAPVNARKSNNRRRRRGRGPQSDRKSRAPSTRYSYNSAPLAMSQTITNYDDAFTTSRLAPHRDYGTGCVVRFSNAFAVVSGNGEIANSQNSFGLSLNSLYNVSAVSGLLTADGANITGVDVFPAAISLRVQRESYNWTFYRFKWLRFRYQPVVPTTVYGTVTMAFTKDPAALIEAQGSQASPTVSYSNLSQAIPNVTSSVYRESELMVKFGSLMLKSEFAAATAPDWIQSNSYGYAAYKDQHDAGRFVCLTNGTAADAMSYGNIWIDGEIEFYGPKASLLSIGTDYQLAALEGKTTPGPRSKNLFQVGTKLRLCGADVKTSKEDQKMQLDESTPGIQENSYRDVLLSVPKPPTPQPTSERSGWVRLGKGS